MEKPCYVLPRKSMPTGQSLFCAVVLFFSLSTSTIATANDNLSVFTMTLEELLSIEIISATGTQKTLRQAPAVATVITADEIKAIGARTLDEVLETIPGLHVSAAGLYYLSSIWSLRGIHTEGNPHVLLLINGLPFTENRHGSRPFTFKMSVSMISRVEVIRGPVSAIHGADAFSGVINVITQNGNEIDGTKAGARYGSFDSSDVWIQHGGLYNGLEIAVGLDAQKSSGDNDRTVSQDVLGSSPPSQAPGPLDTAYEMVEFHLKAKKNALAVNLFGSLHNDNGAGPGNAQALTDGNSIDGLYFLGDISYSSKSILPGWDVGVRASGTFIKIKYFFQLFPSEYQNKQGSPRGEEKNGALSLNVQSEEYNDHHFQVMAGMKYHDLDAEQYKNFGPGVDIQHGPLVDITGTPYSNLDPQHRYIWYCGVQDEWSLGSDVELTLGVRYDEYEDFGGTFNPRAALVWQTSSSLTSKLLYGQAFRAPSFGELYYKENQKLKGNHELDPETIESLDLAFDWRPLENLSAQLNLFTYRIDGLIEYVADQDNSTVFTAQNNKDQEGRGFELKIDWHIIKESLRLQSNFAYQRAKDSDTGEVVANAPEYQFYSNLHYHFWDNWALDTQYFWVGKRHRFSGDQREDIANYDLVNLTLRKKKILSNWEAALGIRNIFNEDIREPSDGRVPDDYPMQSRLIFVELRYML